MNIDAGVSLKNRSVIASVQSAWEAAKVFVERKAVLETEEKLHGQPRPIKPQEFLRLKKAHEKIHGTIAKDELPSSTMVERLIADIEEGEVSAFPLDE